MRLAIAFADHVGVAIEKARLYERTRELAVTDEQGHQSADQLLEEVAHLIKEELRGIDALCRFGGEEFLALLPRTNLQGDQSGGDGEYRRERGVPRAFREL